MTVAATGEKNGYFETVVARHIYVKNDAGELVVILGANDSGNCVVSTDSAQGKELVTLNSTDF